MASKPSDSKKAKEPKEFKPLDLLDRCMAGEHGGKVDGAVAIRKLGLTDPKELIEFLALEDLPPDSPVWDRLFDAWQFFLEHRKDVDKAMS